MIKKIMAKADKADDWEKFDLVRNGGLTALRGHNGNFVTASHHFGHKVSGESGSAGKDELFTIEDA